MIAVLRVWLTKKYARRAKWVLIALAVYALWQRTGSLVNMILLAAGTVAAVLFLWGRRRRRVLVAAGENPPGWKSVAHSFVRVTARKRLLRWKWPRLCKDYGLINKSKDHPRISAFSMKSTLADDITFEVAAGRMGVPLEKIEANLGNITQGVGCTETFLKRTGSGLGELYFYWSDPIARPITLADLPQAAKGQIAFGLHRDNTPATVEMDKSILIGGATGFGKSNIIWTLLADLIRQNIPIRLYVSDPKGGIELTALGEHVKDEMGCLQVMKYAKTAAETNAMVTDLEERMRNSQRWQGGRKHTPTKENPLCILILDELLPLHEMIGQRNKGALGKILYEGRASGYVVWANAQLGHASVLDILRGFIPQRICVKMKSREATDTILGTGAEARGATCSLIPPNQKGVGYAESDLTLGFEKFRAPFVSDEDVAHIAVGAIPPKMNTKTAPTENKRTAVYRVYNHAGALIYVGISNAPALRFAQHIDDVREPWWREDGHPQNEVDWQRLNSDLPVWFDTRAQALAAEERAIREEGPVYNTVHNLRNPLRRIPRAPRPAQPVARLSSRPAHPSTRAPRPRPQPAPEPQDEAVSLGTLLDVAEVPEKRSRWHRQPKPEPVWGPDVLPWEVRR